MSEATKMKRSMSDLIAEAQGGPATQRRTAATTQTANKELQRSAKFAKIEENTFHKIIWSGATPEEKKAAIVEAMTVDPETRELSKERQKEFDVFKEYLQEERKMLAQEIIKLTDTGAFSELKAVIDELNSGLLEFDQRMSPLTDIIDAVYKLRMAGGDTVLGVFQEIKEDEEAEAQRLVDIAATETKLEELKGTVQKANSDVYLMKNSKSGKYRKFFGMGGLKDETIRDIFSAEEKLKAMGEQVAAEAQKLKDLNDPAQRRQSEYQDFLVEKAKLKELLDISSEQHKQRQKELVSAAQNFVTNTDTRVGTVLTHLDGMTGQVNNLFDANNGMRQIYVILTDATKEATAKNQEVHASLQPPEGKEETEIEKMKRESKQLFVEDFITQQGSSAVETVKTLGDLANQGVRIKVMKDANRDQVSKARELHSSGVAGVADRLSMVLQAVNAAALNESSEAAKMAVTSMNEKTNVIAGQEAIRTAVGLKDVSVGLNKAIDEMVQYRELTETTAKMAREGLASIVEGVERASIEAAKTADSLKKSMAAQAEVNNDFAGKTPSNDTKAATTPAAKKGGPADFGKLMG